MPALTTGSGPATLHKNSGAGPAVYSTLPGAMNAQGPNDDSAEFELPGGAESALTPSSEIDTGVLPASAFSRTSGRKFAIDETRRSQAINAPLKARVDVLNFYYGDCARSRA